MALKGFDEEIPVHSVSLAADRQIPLPEGGDGRLIPAAVVIRPLAAAG